ncbi:MAG TPA: hypothetical protein PLB38_02830 [bacterium]|mgnify:CR=1 FL=1|nr:hypothetical protein [bacterium]
MTDEQNNLAPNNLPVAPEQAPAEDPIVVPLAKPVNVPGQAPEATQEPDDMFGDIDSLRVDKPATPQQSIAQAQDALPVRSGGGASSILMKLLIVVVALAVLAGAAVLAYPYIKSMLTAEEETVIVEPEEITVENPYNFDESETPTDYGVTEEMVANEEANTAGGNPLPTISEQAEDNEELMVEPEKSLTEILGGEENVGGVPENEEPTDEEAPVDLNKDTDNDGLTDVEEEKLGTHTMKADTDNDGLSDREEVMTHKTNPLEFDSDGDGLSDADELNVYKSNPLLADTDGDGYTDGVEVSGGYNPNGPGKLEN